MKGFFLFLACALIGTAAFATPARILIIRHAEKPDDPNDPNLSDRGWERAQALTKLFQIHPEYAQPGLPAAIYAKPYEDDSGSMRSIETVTPLAQSMHLTVLTPTKNPQELAASILADPALNGKVVLIAWKHTKIPDVAQAFGAPCPQKWDGSWFDRVWVIDFHHSRLTCENKPQSVLPGDSRLAPNTAGRSGEPVL